MREKELQDYLYDHPEVLFPGCNIQEKAREYAIHGRRIDLLFVVDGDRHIVELKSTPLQRDNIGQVVEYYGLMKEYLMEANLRMILVSPSIPGYRAKYLEELGIRCVESLDSSFGARKELAVELGCPSEKMCDSAQMNMWLHKTVLQKLADNGGNIPKELLD